MISRLAWIRRKPAESGCQERQPRREYLTGESHYFKGRRYGLEVIVGSGRSGIQLGGKAWLEMRVRPGMDRDAREAMLLQVVSEPAAKPHPGVGG